MPQNLDLFDDPHAFSFNGSRTYSSALGGVCCILMVIFIILVAVFEVGVLLNNGGVTTSTDVLMDDGVNSTAITLTTGKNFKLGIKFIDNTNLQTVSVSNYLSKVGISLLKQTYKRNNGTISSTIGSIDLVPCPSGYIESWMGNTDSSYYSGLSSAYCVPDNLDLTISGNPEGQTFSSFKISIYNKAGDATGLANLTSLLNTTYPVLYFSSPRENSLARNV